MPSIISSRPRYSQSSVQNTVRHFALPKCNHLYEVDNAIRQFGMEARVEPADKLNCDDIRVSIVYTSKAVPEVLRNLTFITTREKNAFVEACNKGEILLPHQLFIESRNQDAFGLGELGGTIHYLPVIHNTIARDTYMMLSGLDILQADTVIAWASLPNSKVKRMLEPRTNCDTLVRVLLDPKVKDCRIVYGSEDNGFADVLFFIEL